MKIIDTAMLAEGEWLNLQRITWEDAAGVRRVWESAGRRRGGGAVLMIAENSARDSVILIRQFRPPAAHALIEFPAGLIDPGEAPEEAAVRELKEETGYSGRVLSCSARVYNSPGLSSEFIYFVRMSVDFEHQTDLTTDFDESESIETFPVLKKDLPSFLKTREAAGDAIDSKVLAYSFAFNDSF